MMKAIHAPQRLASFASFDVIVMMNPSGAHPQHQGTAK